MSSRAPEKAYLVAKPTGDQLTCAFNPEKIEIMKSATWRSSSNRGAEEAPPPEFVGTKPRTLKMTLLFEGWETASGDVSADVEMLFSWTNPTEESLDNNQPQPPLVVLHWGAKSYFEVFVKKVKATYKMFDAKGAPIRAEAVCTFEETPMSAEGQNPTSGGIAGRRTHVVVQGESLQSIAYREYRSADRWRALALANGIEDPFSLRPGTSLLIPPARDAAELAAIGGRRGR